jgi:preprotein translocase subunit YajC
MLSNLTTLLTTTAAGTPAPEGAGFVSIIMSLLPLVLMIVVFYFILIRPQRKKDKQVKAMLAALKPGDRICTIGGIYGTITSIKDDTITVAVGVQKVPLVFARWAIRSVEDAPLENDSEPLV